MWKIHETPPREGILREKRRITWSRSREKIPAGTRGKKKKSEREKRAERPRYVGAHKARVKNARPRRTRPACRCENRTRAPLYTRGACVRACVA